MFRWLGLVLLLIPALAWPQLLSSFESEAEMAQFSPSGAVGQRVPEHATHGAYSLRMEFKGSPKDSWPGLLFRPSNQDFSTCSVLAFDVHNAEEFEVPLSLRLDDARGKNQFLGWNLPARKTTTVEIWLAAHRYSLDLKHITSILPYLRMPRRDATLYFDNFRLQAGSARFQAMVYEETTPEPAVSAVDRTRGYVAFTRPVGAQVFPQTRPREDERQTPWQLFGCPGQVLSLTVSLWPLRDLGATRLGLTDLHRGRHVIPTTSAVAYPVRCLDKRVYYSSDYYIQDMPALLEERAEVKVTAGRCQTFWIELRVPEDAIPGLYEGTVTVLPQTGEKLTRKLALRVLPYRLVEPATMYWGVYYTGPKLTQTPEQTNAAIRRDLADQRAHGMTSVGLCFGMESTEFAVQGTQVQVAPQADGRYAVFMEAYKKLKFPCPVIQLNDAGQTAAAAHPLYSEEWKTTYKNYWIEMARLHRERGWPELIVQPVDEPGWQGPDERERNVFCLKALKEIPGQRTEQDGPGDSYFLNVAGPYSDVWNFNGALAEPEVIARLLKEGRTVLTYNNDVENFRPEMQRYVNGFYQLRAGAHGSFNWEYMGFNGSPYDDQDAPHDSWLTRYPPLPELGEVGGASTGWAGARIGVDDYRYATTLRAAVGRGLKSRSRTVRNAAQQGQHVLQSVLATLSYSPRTRGTAAWGSEKPGPEGTKRLTGQLKVPNGWDFETYERARWQLASATVHVMSLLGEVKKPASPPRPAKPTSPNLLSGIQWTVRPPAGAGTGTGTAAKNVAVPTVSQAPACDGDLSDGVWKEAASLGPFTLMDGSGPPSQQTNVLVCADQTHLYFGVECLEENIAQLTARVDKDGGQVWMDDCVELYFDPTAQRASYRQIIVNSLGKVAWNDPADKAWRPAVLRGARADREHKRWFVEIGVPLAGLGLSSSIFGLNVCRERRPLESLELSCWSPTGQGFAHPERFGVATLGGSYLEGHTLGRGVLGLNEFAVKLRNPGAESRQMVAQLNWRQAGHVALYRQAPPVALPAGAALWVKLNYEIVSDQSPVEMELTVKDGASGRVLAQRRVQQKVAPGLTMALRPRLYYLSETAGNLEVTLNLAPELLKRAALVMVISEARSGRVLRKGLLRQLSGDTLHAALNLGGLGVGTYRVEAVLKAGPSDKDKRLSTATTEVLRLVGPFD